IQTEAMVPILQCFCIIQILPARAHLWLTLLTYAGLSQSLMEEETPPPQVRLHSPHRDHDRKGLFKLCQ
uniref:Uncharacterized protein n=1 Tax=Denticeps clupeoides TaxID=299321 RepID=A0AAY4DIR1_9TELE